MGFSLERIGRQLFPGGGEWIWVAQGTFSRWSGAARTLPVLRMKEGVSFFGGFLGTETELAKRGEPLLHPTASLTATTPGTTWSWAPQTPASTASRS